MSFATRTILRLSGDEAMRRGLGLRGCEAWNHSSSYSSILAVLVVGGVGFVVARGPAA